MYTPTQAAEIVRLVMTAGSLKGEALCDFVRALAEVTDYDTPQPEAKSWFNADGANFVANDGKVTAKGMFADSYFARSLQSAVSILNADVAVNSVTLDSGCVVRRGWAL